MILYIFIYKWYIILRIKNDIVILLVRIKNDIVILLVRIKMILLYKMIYYSLE